MFQRRTIGANGRMRFLLLVVLLVLAGWLGQQDEHAGVLLAQDEDTPTPDTIRINEIMPNPDDGVEWVELYKSVGNRAFLPVVMNAATGGASTVSPATTTDTRPLANTSLAGWQLGNEEGVWYTLPSDLPPVPLGAYIVVYFDGKGAGANDYDLSDNVIELHTPAGMTGVFGDDEGQVALYSSDSHSAETIQSFVAWGNTPPGTAAQNAAEAGVWQTNWAVPAEANAGDIVEPPTTDVAYGVIPEGDATHLNGWSAYDEEDSTPGGANVAPRPRWLKTDDGAVMDVNEFAVGWQAVPGADEYQFQMAPNDSFADPSVDVMTDEPAYVPPSHPMQARVTQPLAGSQQVQSAALGAGTFYWRVRAYVNGRWSAWSVISRLELLDPGSICTTVTIGMPWKLQHSDTPMLELDGSPETGQNAWDAPDRDADGNPVRGTPLGNNYCVRASVAMVNAYYGGALSQDRISHYVLEEWSTNTRPNTNDGMPENDLGYGRGMYYPDEEDEAFSWALGVNVTATGGKPDFDDFKTWIDEGRGIMMRNPGHMMAVEGYRTCADGSQWLHINDPWDAPRWQEYDSQNMDGVWPGPAGVGGAPGARSDESTIWMDWDGDGVSDFDEINRFFTSRYNADSDSDLVTDQNDIREYVFDSAGTYNKRNPDVDGDESRKELDADNDNDGAIDGCEDSNRNGRYEPGLGETNNFSSFSTATCDGPLLYVNWPKMDFDTYIKQRNFQIRNMGSDTLDWSIDTSEFPDWLSVSETSGSVEPLRTEDQDTVYVNVDRTGLEPGEYSHTIEVESNDGSAFTTALVKVVPTTELPPAEYDSGWTPIKADSALAFNHNLGGDVDDYRVVLEYRTDDSNGVNLRYYGGADFGANPAPGHQENARVGAYWRSLTDSSITVYRRPEDTYALDVRVRIWVVPEADYDSGWVSMGQDHSRHFVHELGGRPEDYLVDVQYRTAGDDVNARYFGGIDFGATSFDGTRNDDRMGAYWRSLDDRNVWVYRRPEDIYADQVRVRIWRMAPADYDSGWVAVNQNQAQTLSHNLGGDENDYLVDMMYNAGSGTFDGVNARYFGGADFGTNPPGGHQENDRVGAYWRSLTDSSVTVYRRHEDSYAPWVRIRIWGLSP